MVISCLCSFTAPRTLARVLISVDIRAGQYDQVDHADFGKPRK